ncbi:hypothetical protein ABH920_001450 [Catenulispora sp. EB89]|uniref:hypothetical protein n=1 Tax=Catenulispora sp. EB89 TaxID=3156257 RepID=UPI003519A150
MTDAELARLRELDRHLARGMFGDSSALRANADVYYGGLYALLGKIFPPFADLAEKAHSPQSRSLLRGFADEAFLRLRDREERSDERLRQLVELVAYARSLEPVPPVPVSALAPATAGLLRPPTLTDVDDTLGQQLAQRFHAAMAHDGFTVEIALQEPAAPSQDSVDRAFRLLYACLPTVAPETAALVDGVVLFQGAPHSAYISATPLVIYLNERVAADPLAGADSVLHESLHQKLVDFGLARRMLRSGYQDAASHRAPVPWGGPGRSFTADRTLAAFHVYVHLTLLHAVALLDRDGLGLEHTESELTDRLAVRWARAAYLGSCFDERDLAAELDVDGAALVAWLGAVNAELGELVLSSGDRLKAVASVE